MLLYNESFPLKKGLRFSSYIKKLDEQGFVPYTLLIKKTDNPEIYSLEIKSNDFMFYQFIYRGVLLNHCTIQYNKKDREFTISAYFSSANLLLPLIYLSMAFCFFGVIFLSTIIENFTVKNIFISLAPLIIFLLPYIVMYSNERKFLERIGAIGEE